MVLINSPKIPDVSKQLDFLDKALSLPGVKFIDSSCISSGFFEGIVSARDIHFQHACLDSELGFCDSLRGMLNEDSEIGFSEGIAYEFYRSNLQLRHLRRNLDKDKHYHCTNRKGVKYRGISSLRRECLNELSDHIGEVFRRRDKFRKEIILKHPAEKHISPSLQPYLNKFKELTREIADMPGVTVSYSQRYGSPGPRLENHYNDADLVAIALCCENSGVIVTKDTDFGRICSKIYITHPEISLLPDIAFFHSGSGDYNLQRPNGQVISLN